MSPLVLVVVFVVGISLVAARLIMGTGARKDKPLRAKKRKPARKSTSKKQNRKTPRRRKSGFDHVDDDDDLLEMLFETARDKRK